MNSPNVRTPGSPPALLQSLLLVLLSWAVPPWSGTHALSAQEPQPALPTAADLELYALAVDSAAYPDESTVLLLQERTLRVDADGAYSRGLRQVRQVLDESAVEVLAELSFGYDPSRASFSLDWARVVEPDGTVVGAEPVHVQVLDQPVSRNAPVYTEVKRVRASLGDVTEGRIVDWRYTLTTTDPPIPGDVLMKWTANSSTPIRRSRFVLETPQGWGPDMVERNLDGPTEVREEGGRRIRVWDYEDQPPIEPEPFAADSNGVVKTVTVGGPLEWDDVARWYAELAEDRYVMTPELESRLDSLVRDAATLEDSLRAVHRWVAQDVRYASISLGIGGYQPRPPEEVAISGVGDCKDKTTLFLTLTRHMGVNADPVLVQTGGAVDPALPSVRAFNHMVAALRLEGEWIYLDLTVPVAPFGEVHGRLQGRRGVRVRGDGTAELVRFPESEPSANRSSIVIEGTLAEDGSFEGTYTETVTGAIQYRMRREFARNRAQQARNRVARNLANRVFEGATTDSMELFDGSDLDATPRLWARVVADSVLEAVPGGWLLRPRIPGYGSAELVARLEEDTLRSFPIDTEEVFGRREHYTEVRLTLPEGWTAELPESVRVEGVFGLYESTYRQDGRELLLRRTVRGTDRVVSPDHMDELVEWIRTQQADRLDYLVLRPPGGTLE